MLVFGPGRRSADGGCVGSPPQPNLPELTCQPHGVALLNLLFGSGGTWLDPLLPLLVLALIIWGVRRQQLSAISSAVTDSK
ncbi:hypothetical protein [Aeromonas dhakensis]|uniref:hypothetical protein n=1 Tax=Aeromonas dhakensis TaxID=196024 RepID=UPI002442CDED|nr:hypothetical protein [Aeromonas dhakensis]